MLNLYYFLCFIYSIATFHLFFIFFSHFPAIYFWCLSKLTVIMNIQQLSSPFATLHPFKNALHWQYHSAVVIIQSSLLIMLADATRSTNLHNRDPSNNPFYDITTQIFKKFHFHNSSESKLTSNQSWNCGQYLTNQVVIFFFFFSFY